MGGFCLGLQNQKMNIRGAALPIVASLPHRRELRVQPPPPAAAGAFRAPVALCLGAYVSTLSPTRNTRAHRAERRVAAGTGTGDVSGERAERMSTPDTSAWLRRLQSALADGADASWRSSQEKVRSSATRERRREPQRGRAAQGLVSQERWSWSLCTGARNASKRSAGGSSS